MSEKAPLQWIRMALTPLPHMEETLSPTVIFWNHETGELAGEGVEQVQPLIDEYVKAGSITNRSGETIPVTLPLTDNTALGLVLSQHYWVSPQPVDAPEEPPHDTPLQ